MIGLRAFVAAPLLLLATACASGSGGGSEEAEAEFEEQVGRVMVAPLTEAIDKILPKYRLGIRRQESQYSAIYLETEWQTRPVTAEEQVNGVLDARQRALIQGRRVGQTLDGQGEYRVVFTAQNEVRTEAEPSWQPAPAPPSFFEYWRKIYNDLRLEVATGVRR